MTCCFQIQNIKLPKQFLFDSLHFYAQFQSASVDLLKLGFDIAKSAQQRNVDLNIKLRVPSLRTKFKLVLQIKIINMRVRACEIVVDLSSPYKLHQYVFGTAMGRVSAFAHVIECHSLPKQLDFSASHQNSSVNISESVTSQKQSNQKQGLVKHTTSKEIRTNDEQQQ